MESGEIDMNEIANIIGIPKSFITKVDKNSIYINRNIPMKRSQIFRMHDVAKKNNLKIYDDGNSIIVSTKQNLFG